MCLTSRAALERNSSDPQAAGDLSLDAADLPAWVAGLPIGPHPLRREPVGRLHGTEESAQAVHLEVGGAAVAL